MHIFIDANIFVNFFDLKKGSLSELEMLIKVAKSSKATLWLPEQTKREFWRNREKSIKKNIQDFEEWRSLGNPPLLIREHQQFDELSKKANDIDEMRRNIAKSIKKDIDNQTTHADKIIRELFSVSKPIDTDNDDIFNAAWRRSKCHLPPGKNDGIGDRLCWVGLLHALPENASLHIVSDDSDYKNEGFSESIRPYLDYEWRQKKKGNIALWNRISGFLTANFPNVKNAAEMEKIILTKNLRESGSYASTHQWIGQLCNLKDFSKEQSRLIAEAIIENSQVRDIRYDDDIRAFYLKFIKEYEKTLDVDLLSGIQKIL